MQTINIKQSRVYSLGNTVLDTREEGLLPPVCRRNQGGSKEHVPSRAREGGEDEISEIYLHPRANLIKRSKK